MIILNELTYKNGKLVVQPVEYKLVNRNDKQYAEPIGKSRDSVGIGDKQISISAFWPLEHRACFKCDVYGLVHTLAMGEYVCVNCGDKNIFTPETKLEII